MVIKKSKKKDIDKSKKKNSKKERKKSTKKNRKKDTKKSRKKNKTQSKSQKNKEIKKGNAKKNEWVYLDNVNASILCPTAERTLKENMKSIITTKEQNNVMESSIRYILDICNTKSENYSVFFTSGEIESNRIILACAVNAYRKIRKTKPHIIISSCEHSSMLTYAKSLFDGSQIELTIITPNAYGCVVSEDIIKHIKPTTCLVSITYINKELGSVNNINKISELLHARKIPLHSDCTYLFGKHTLDLSKNIVDAATVSFDKINGPIGVGSLILRNDFLNGYKLQEHSTTLNGGRTYCIPLISSAIESLKFSLENRDTKNKKLLSFRNKIINQLSNKSQVLTFANFMKADDPPLAIQQKKKTKIVVLGPPASNTCYYTPSILSLVIINKTNKTNVELKQYLEKKNIIIGIPDKTELLDQIGMPQEAQQFVVRISIPDNITKEKIDLFIATIKKLL